MRSTRYGYGCVTVHDTWVLEEIKQIFEESFKFVTPTLTVTDFKEGETGIFHVAFQTAKEARIFDGMARTIEHSAYMPSVLTLYRTPDTVITWRE